LPKVIYRGSIVNTAVHTEIHVFYEPIYSEMTIMAYVEVLRSWSGIFPTSFFVMAFFQSVKVVVS
jgi:hypothetical protein